MFFFLALPKMAQKREKPFGGCITTRANLSPTQNKQRKCLPSSSAMDNSLCRFKIIAQVLNPDECGFSSTTASMVKKYNGKPFLVRTTSSFFSGEVSCQFQNGPSSQFFPPGRIVHALPPLGPANPVEGGTMAIEFPSGNPNQCLVSSQAFVCFATAVAPSRRVAELLRGDRRRPQLWETRPHRALGPKGRLQLRRVHRGLRHRRCWPPQSPYPS